MVKKKKSKKTKPLDEKKSARLNLLIHPELREWARSYAKKKHTSISGIITDHFVRLKEEEHNLNVEQI